MRRSVLLDQNLTISWTRKAKCGNNGPEPFSSNVGTETLAISIARLPIDFAGTESLA